MTLRTTRTPPKNYQLMSLCNVRGSLCDQCRDAEEELVGCCFDFDQVLRLLLQGSFMPDMENASHVSAARPTYSSKHADRCC